MTLRDDVRDYFERESRRMPAPGGLRSDVMAHASAAPAVTPSIRWAAVLAAVLAVAIVAGLVAVGQLRHNATVVPGHVRVGAGQSAGLMDADLVDPLRGWALIGVCDSHLTNCQAWVESTSDGGRSWGGAVEVVPKFEGLSGDSPRYIHFANATDGFVYGLGVAFVTHDAGQTWSRTPGEFSDLVLIDGSATVWELLRLCPAGSQCPMSVRSSVTGGRTWTNAAALPSGLQPDQLVAFGTSGLLLAGPGTGDLALTSDGGRTWRSIPGRCAPGTTGNSVTTPDGAEIWQMCAPSSVSVSTDGGMHWATRPSPGAAVLGAPFVVSPRPGMALMLTPATAAAVTPTLYTSQDEGASWRVVPTGRTLFGFIFCDTSHAWASDAYGNIWASADSGLTWAKLPSQPV